MTRWYPILLFVLITSISCSENIEPVASPFHNDPGQNSTLEHDNNSHYGNIFGAWRIIVDLSNYDFSVLPARSATTIGDVFDSDLSQFLTISPCTNCLSISSIKLDNYGDLNIEFRLKHPFNDIEKRPDLHGFDVRGIFITDYEVSPMFPAIDVVNPDGTMEPALMPFGVMLNPDGYTSHYDDLVTDERYFIGGEDLEGNINPFLRFFQNAWEGNFNPQDPSGYNVMPVGADYDSRRAVFSLGSISLGSLELYLIADVAYGQSAIFTNRTSPTYYLPEFNRTEAWRIEYWIENNVLLAGASESTADVVIQVFDWQHGSEVDASYPDPTNLAGISKRSNVAELELAIPGLMSNSVTVSTPETGDGSPLNPLQYRITVQNEKLASYNQMGLLAVRDDLWGEQGRLPVPESPSGFPIATEDILDYALYHEIWVNFPSQDPLDYNNEILVESGSYTTIENIRVKPTHIQDPGHTKFQYFWDYEYDGATFDPDGYGIPSPLIPLDPGLNIAGLGVVTSSVPPRQYAYAIPIVREGEMFNTHVTGDIQSEFSYLGTSLYITDDRVYIAFTRADSGNLDVYLSTGDFEGNFSTVSVTSPIPYPCLNPSIAVIESRPGEGVYVVFEVYHDDEFRLQSNKTDLDGSPFDASNFRYVANETNIDERYPDFICTPDGRLLLYYTATSPTDSDINVAYSDDYSESWFQFGSIHSTNSSNQLKQSAGYSESEEKVFCVWEDYRDEMSRGVDIYLSQSDDGLNFNPEECLSSKSITLDHLNPQLTVLNDQIGVAYISLNPSGDELRLRITNTDRTTETDHLVVKSENGIHVSNAAITSSSPGKFILNYGLFDSSRDELTVLTSEIRTSSNAAGFTEKILRGEISGDTDLLNSLNPAIASRGIFTDQYGRINGIYALSGWTSFTESYIVIDEPEPVHAGAIKTDLRVTSYY